MMARRAPPRRTAAGPYIPTAWELIAISHCGRAIASSQIARLGHTSRPSKKAFEHISLGRFSPAVREQQIEMGDVVMDSRYSSSRPDWRMPLSSSGEVSASERMRPSGDQPASWKSRLVRGRNRTVRPDAAALVIWGGGPEFFFFFGAPSSSRASPRMVGPGAVTRSPAPVPIRIAVSTMAPITWGAGPCEIVVEHRSRFARAAGRCRVSGKLYGDPLVSAKTR